MQKRNLFWLLACTDYVHLLWTLSWAVGILKLGFIHTFLSYISLYSNLAGRNLAVTASHVKQLIKLSIEVGDLLVLFSLSLSLS